jgi:hypothetical protein
VESAPAPEPEPELPPLPPLPTRVRFEARYRDAPKQSPNVTMAIFVALIVFMGFCGVESFRAIGQFLQMTQKSLEYRRTHPPTPEPIQVEFVR